MTQDKNTAICSFPVPIPPQAFEYDRQYYYTSPYRSVVTELVFNVWLKVEKQTKNEFYGWTLANCTAESPIQRRLQRRALMRRG